MKDKETVLGVLVAVTRHKKTRYRALSIRGSMEQMIHLQKKMLNEKNIPIRASTARSYRRSKLGSKEWYTRHQTG